MNQLGNELTNNNQEFIVCPMTTDEVKLALSWAKAEGWNPGINDAYNYYVTDKKGFLIGKLNGNPISCISVVRYNEKHH